MSSLFALNEASTIVLYLVVICASCTLAYVYENYLSSGKSLGCIGRVFGRVVVVALPAVLFGLRSQFVGWDTLEYLNSFISLQYSDPSTLLVKTRSPGFTGMMWFLGLLSNWNFSVVLIIVHGISLYLVVFALERFSQRISIPFGLFVYFSFCGFFAMDQIRQLFAMSIWLCAIPFALNRNTLRYVVLTLVASLFHWSLLLALPFILFVFEVKRPNQVLGFTVAVACALLAIGAPYLFNIMGSVLGNLDYYAAYFDSSAVTAAKEYEGTGLGYLISLLPFAFPLIFYRRYLPRAYISFFVACFVVSVPLRMLGYESVFLARLYLIPSLAIVYVYPIIFTALSADLREKRAFTFASVLLLGFFFIYFACTSHGIVPYSINLLAA